MTYCTPDDVYDLTSLTSTDADSTKLGKIIEVATANLNANINVRIDDELVVYISAEKDNEIDDSNTTFYTQKVPIGDYNNDGNISADDIKVYTIDNDGTRASYTVSSIDDASIGKFTLSSAPSQTETLYISYVKAPLDEIVPHPLIKLACVYLSASLGHTMVGTDKYKTLKLGRLSVMKFGSEFSSNMNMYNSTINQINDTMSDMIEGKGFMD